MKRKELFAQAEAKRAQAATLMNAETPDVAGANALLDEVDAIMAEIAVIDRMAAANVPAAGEPAPAPAAKNEVADFINAMRTKFTKVADTISHVPSATTGTEGGYTIPEDIQTKVNRFKESEAALQRLFKTETTSMPKGSRVYKSKRTRNVMSKINEWGTVSQVEAPSFVKKTYTIEDYAGFIPCPNNLLADSDAAIEAMLVETLGAYDVDTKNKELLDVLDTKTLAAVTDINGIRKAVNIDLGPAYKPTVKILTNEYGIDWLDGLEDENGRPMLNPDPTDSAKLQLRCGSTIVEVVEYPSVVVPNKTANSKVYAPFYIASFEDVATVMDRQQLSIAVSSEATIGNYNAFAQNGTLFRGIARFDVMEVDGDAWVVRGVEIGDAPSTSQANG